MTTSVAGAAVFAAYFVTLYAAHHIGDYWVQSDWQARTKGRPGAEGRIACLNHVLGYLMTQVTLLAVVGIALGLEAPSWTRWWVALTISGVTHYVIDRRRPLELLARLIDQVSGKLSFYRLGQDSGALGTGAWALDQSLHILLSVFVPALILAS